MRRHDRMVGSGPCGPQLSHQQCNNLGHRVARAVCRDQTQHSSRVDRSHGCWFVGLTVGVTDILNSCICVAITSGEESKWHIITQVQECIQWYMPIQVCLLCTCFLHYCINLVKSLKIYLPKTINELQESIFMWRHAVLQHGHFYGNRNQYSFMQASFYIIVHNSFSMNFSIHGSSAWWSHGARDCPGYPGQSA